MTIDKTCTDLVKQCGCGRHYDAPTWLALPLCGYVGKRVAGGSWRYTELRHCACCSTIGVDLLWMPHGDDTPDDSPAAAPVSPSGEAASFGSKADK
jgi:hypothetical protein